MQMTKRPLFSEWKALHEMLPSTTTVALLALHECTDALSEAGALARPWALPACLLLSQSEC